MGSGIAMAKAKAPAKGQWEPARHKDDDWMDEVPGKHRLVIDTTNLEGIQDGLLFASNFILANRTGYGLQEQDVAIIVVARHFSTGFGFNNDMWSKYGVTLTPPSPGAEGQGKPPAKANPHSESLATLAKQGVRFAVCAMATHRLAGMIARVNGGNADAIYSELTANLVTNARMVPAGIIAVNRAQERGYSLVTA